MHIKSIRVRNFLTFGDVPLAIDDLVVDNVLVGPNGGGKSSLFRAIEFVGLVMSGNAPWAGPYVHQQDPTKGIEIDIGCRLSSLETHALVTTALFSATAQQFQPGGQPPINSEDADRAISSVVRSSSDMFQRPFSSDIHFVVSSAVGHSQDLQAHVRTSFPHEGLCLDQEGRLMRAPYTARSWDVVTLQAEVYRSIVQARPGAFQFTPNGAPVEPELLSSISESLTTEWLWDRLGPREGRRVALHVSAFQPNQSRLGGAQGQPRDVINLLSFLASRGNRQRYITPYEVLGAIYNSSVVHLSDERLKFRSTSGARADPSGRTNQSISGADLCRDLFALKVSPYGPDRRRFEELQRRFESLTRVSFDAVRSTRTVPASEEGGQATSEPYEDVIFAEGSLEYPVDLAAAGHCELLLVLYSVFGPTNSIILLDEPALNLHPVKQRELHAVIRLLAHESDNQSIIVTHSPSFVQAQDLDGILRMARAADASVVTRIRGTSADDRASIAKLLIAAPDMAALLFARRVVLLEGEDEEAALPVWFSKCNGGVGLEPSGTVFQNVHGKLSFGRYARVLDDWGIPVRMVGDGNSADVLSAFTGRAFWFQQEDFTALASEFCPDQYRAARKEWGGRPKDPLVARSTAIGSDPPPPIWTIFESLRSFLSLEGSEPVTLP